MVIIGSAVSGVDGLGSSIEGLEYGLVILIVLLVLALIVLDNYSYIQLA